VRSDDEKEATKTEANDDEIMPARWLDDLTKDQRIRIELLLEEMIAAGDRLQSIRNTMKRALDKEIRFAAHPPRVLKKMNHRRKTSDTSSQLGETRKTEREVL
jgi:S-adenosylmethionine:tRNA-ribosyltransferase-isomerase (queuine synthetase)